MDKEELRQRLENSGEDWGTPRKTAKLQGQRTSRESIAKASRRRDNCRETGRAVGKLASLSRTEGTSTCTKGCVAVRDVITKGGEMEG